MSDERHREPTAGRPIARAAGSATRPRSRLALLAGCRQARRAPGDAVETRVLHEGDRALVWLFGELDLAGEDGVVGALGSLTAPQVVISLAHLSFLDLRGLDALLHGCSLLERRGQHVRFVGARPLAKRLFELAGRSGLLEETDAEARPRVVAR